jgi:cellulose synthase/poly-beta-1,6-N-acetylglucosamine synthase-like glycosyltransferase
MEPIKSLAPVLADRKSQLPEFAQRSAPVKGNSVTLGTATASKQTVASATIVLSMVLLGMGFLLPSAKVRHNVAGSRSLLLDNAKVVAQFLVIYMHIFYYNLAPSWGAQVVGYDDRSTWLYGSTDLMKSLLDGFSAVMIPMLCFISGVLSQGPTTQRRLRRFIERIFIPTLIWVCLVKPVIVDTMIDPKPKAFAERLNAALRFRSFHEEWYLQALVLWRGSVFLLWSHLQPAVALLSMLGLSGLAGYCDLTGPLWYLKLDDAMGFLPYFAIGYVFPFDAACRFTAQMHIPRMVALGLVFLWVFALIPLAGPLPDGHGNYNCCAAGTVFHTLQSFDYSLYWTRRLARVLLELPPTLVLFFYVIPRCETPLSWIGPHTLYPYLFHQVANHWRNQFVQYMHPPKLQSTPFHIAVLLLHMPYALALVVFFASESWRRLFSWCFEPTWLMPLLKEDHGTGKSAADDPFSSSPALDKDAFAKQFQDSQTHHSSVDDSCSACPKSAQVPIPAAAATVADVGVVAAIAPLALLEEDTADAESIPELQPSHAKGRFIRWKSTGVEIPWQCQARKYYLWLLPIFVGTLISASFPFFLCMFYLPGWEVLLKVVDGLPLCFGVPFFFVALASTVANYAWHFYRLRGTEEVPEPSTVAPLAHAVVIVAYKEPLDVLRRTVDSIVSQSGLGRRPIVVFAAEERDETAQSTFTALSEHVGSAFDMFLLTKHALKEGETIGKSSNENFAVQELYKLLVEEQARDPFEVLVTIVDADSILSHSYLAHAEKHFRAQRDGRRLIYSGPLSVHRNFNDAGLLTQCYELHRCHADTFFDPFSMYQPQSNYSLTLGFAQELGFWTPDLMPEDIHTANKARINNFGSSTTVAIPSLICNDLVVTFADRYTQAKRHQMGSITEFAWGMSLFFETQLSFPGWWAVFKVEAGRDGSFLDIAKAIIGYGCKVTIGYLLFAHWSLLHWKARLYLGFAICVMVWNWLWFWIAELFLWQTLLTQFPVKRPSVGRWVLIVCTMPMFLFVGEVIFYLASTLQCLWRITFVGELSYVCAPKGDDLVASNGTSASTASECSSSRASSGDRISGEEASGSSST